MGDTKWGYGGYGNGGHGGDETLRKGEGHRDTNRMGLEGVEIEQWVGSKMDRMKKDRDTR